eukprot:4702759-Amphidinium_carterae.1
MRATLLGKQRGIARILFESVIVRFGSSLSCAKPHQTHPACLGLRARLEMVWGPHELTLLQAPSSGVVRHNQCSCALKSPGAAACVAVPTRSCCHTKTLEITMRNMSLKGSPFRYSFASLTPQCDV